MPKHVFVTRNIPLAGVRLLEDRHAVSVYSEAGALDRDTLIRRVRDADALVCMLSDSIDADVLDQAPRLRVIANYAVGYNNIDVQAAADRDILVTHTPDVLTNATGELAFALLITLTRKILTADRFTRQGRFRGWDPLLLLGDELAGKTAGIIGMGRIGRNMAAKCRAFGMKIVYYGRRPVPPDTAEALDAVRCENLTDLLRRSDVVSIHTPLTPETRHMIDQKALAAMKPGAYLINTARGEVVDEAALVSALVSGHLKGAGMDVYENEPVVTDALLTMDNVVLLPHIGSATVETRTRMAEMVAENVIAVLAGETPPNLVPEMAG